MLAREVLMIRPAAFGFNPETAASNAFQQRGVVDDALREFDGVVEQLTRAGVRVHVFDDRPELGCPDAIFPNNWVSFHEEGAVLYPMASPSRRREVRHDIIEALGRPVLWDLTGEAERGRFLEGTGSLVLEREDRFAFACISDRTDRMLAFQWCQKMGYRLVDFETSGPGGIPVYHSNVVGSIGEGLAVVCPEVILEKAILAVFMDLSDWSVVSISADQMSNFCGNVLQLMGAGPVVAMSETAWKAFTPDQRRQIEMSGEPVVCRVPTIERVGGGSVRCMLAELF